MKTKKMIVCIAVLLIILLSGCNSEDKEILSAAEDLIEAGDLKQASSYLSNHDSKKGNQIKEAIDTYYKAEETFWYSRGYYDDGYQTGFEETYEVLNDIDSIYKDYTVLKEKVDSMKSDMKAAIEMEEELRKDVETMQKAVDAGNEDEAKELADEWVEKIDKEFPEDQGDYNGDISARLQEIIYEYTKTKVELTPGATFNTDADIIEESLP